MYGRILVALDGSAWALAGGQIALQLAEHSGAEIIALHAYGAELHSTRFREMEGFLPGKYQDEEGLQELRDAHGSLILDGFLALSRGYMERFLAAAASRGVSATEVSVEGRNYVRIIEAAAGREVDCVVVGAQGLGEIGDGLLGSTTARVLREVPCDVLVARPARPLGGPVLAGIDGGDPALAMLERAAGLARAAAQPLEIATAYDPQLHTQVFKAMAGSLSEDVQEQVGLSRQEDLHEELIDDGLGRMYEDFLADAVERAHGMGIEGGATLLRGKAYHELCRRAGEIGAGIVVVSRTGRHHEGLPGVGSNAEAVVRLCGTSVLVVAPDRLRGQDAGDSRTAGEHPAPRAQDTGVAMEWDADALARLARVPRFARPMARRGIEKHARSKGRNRVTLAMFLEVARRMGMGGGADA